MKSSILCGFAVKNSLDNVNSINFQFLESATQQSAEIMIFTEQSKLATLGGYFSHGKMSRCRCCWQWFQNQCV